GRLETLAAGTVGIAQSRMKDDPKYAPTALKGLKQGRQDLDTLRSRLVNLEAKGEDTDDLAYQADTLLLELLASIAEAELSTGQYREALATCEGHFKLAQEALDRWTGRRASNRLELEAEVARTYATRARIRHRIDVEDAALDDSMKGVTLVEDVLDRGYDEELSWRMLIVALMIRSDAFERLGQFEDAETDLDRAETICIDRFGPEPESLNNRRYRGEIEIRRSRVANLQDRVSDLIHHCERAIFWFDGGQEGVEGRTQSLVMRIDAGRRLARAYGRDGRNEDAEKALLDLKRVTERMVAIRSKDPLPDDQFVGLLANIEAELVRVQVRSADPTVREAALAVLLKDRDEARAEFLERPGDQLAAGKYMYTAGVYVNQAMMRADAPNETVLRAIDVVRTALAETRDADESSKQIYVYRRSCIYAQGLALVRAGRASEVMECAAQLEQQARAGGPIMGAFGFRLAADLWSELIPILSDSEEEAYAYGRTLDLLEAAVDAGYGNLSVLKTNEALEPVRADPRFQALLQKVESEIAKD
ncbi:MAG: hypothetical protein AAGG01_22440, partial [Planctomycetota bacterium]